MILLHVLTPRFILHVCIAHLARRSIVIYATLRNTTPNPHLLYLIIRALHQKSQLAPRIDTET